MKNLFFITGGSLLVMTSIIILVSCHTVKKSVNSKVTATDSVIVSKGESFKITVRANPSTGYDWQMDLNLTDKNVITYINQVFKVDNDAVGSPGDETWNFKAIDSGRTSIKLTYLRSWIPDKPAEIKIFNVVVK